MTSGKLCRTTLIGVGCVFVISFITFLFTMPAGDDWVYAGVLSGAHPQIDVFWKLPGSWFGHWLDSNGRLANFVLTPLMLIPACIRALICAIFVVAFYWLTILCSGARQRPILSALLAAAICFVLPWWDSMTLFACQTNYVWASVGILAALYIIICEPRLPLWLAFLITAAGAAFHESATLGAGIGLCVWLMFNPAKFDYRRRRLAVAFLLGALLCVASPGIWLRAESGSVADDPFLPLLIKSDLPAAVLVLAVGLTLCFPTYRNRMMGLLRSSAGVYFYGAVVCTAISLFSGIVGRSGWFGSVFAFIFIALWLQEWLHFRRSYTSLSMLIWVAVIFQLGFCASWQAKLYRETVKFREEYVNSTDGRVFLDYTRLPDLPFMTLGKVRGVPDADDLYLLFTFARYHSPDSPRPLVFPTQVHCISEIPARLENGDRIIDKTIEPDLYTVGFDGDTLFAYRSAEGSIWVCQSLDSLWHLSPQICAPGDRLSFERITDKK